LPEHSAGTAAPVAIDILLKVKLFVCKHSRKKYKQTEVRECLLSFGAEYFVFQFAIQKF
jgi:hypothetical protein